MNVRYEPVKEIVVHDANRMAVKELAIFKIIGQTSQPWLLWCDGILFSISGAADNKKYDDTLEKGTLVINRLFYAELPEYTPIISVDTEFGGIKVNVEEVGWSKVFKQLAAWAKSQKDD